MTKKDERKSHLIDAILACWKIWGRCGSPMELMQLTDFSYHSIYNYLVELDREGIVSGYADGAKKVRVVAGGRPSAEMLDKVRAGVKPLRYSDIFPSQRGMETGMRRGMYRPRREKRKTVKAVTAAVGPNPKAQVWGDGWYLRRDYVQTAVSEQRSDSDRRSSVSDQQEGG